MLARLARREGRDAACIKALLHHIARLRQSIIDIHDNTDAAGEVDAYVASLKRKREWAKFSCRRALKLQKKAWKYVRYYAIRSGGRPDGALY